MDTIVTIDAGSQNTRVIIAERQTDGGIRILGLGESDSDGIVRGNVVNVEKASLSILKALKDAENISGMKVARATVAVGGDSLNWVKSHGVVPIPRDRKQIVESDVAALLNSARAVIIPPDHRIIESYVESYKVDSQRGIENPIGMTGIRLEGDVNLATLEKGTIDNFAGILTNQRVGVEHFTLGIQGSVRSVLTDDEAELGACVLDFGAGTTDIGVCTKKRLVYADVVRYAGASITHDISVGLQIPLNQAEELKMKYGHTCLEAIGEDEEFDIPGMGGRKPRTVRRSFLVSIIEPRVEEIFTMVLEKLQNAGAVRGIASGGIVITGGSSLMPGVVATAEKVFDMPVRIGLPLMNSDLDKMVQTPHHAAVLGAVFVSISKENEIGAAKRTSFGALGALYDKIKDLWIKKLMG